MKIFDVNEAPFLFVVDTDSYSGNFERELVGYMTGADNGTHGEEEADEFKKDFPKEAKKIQAIILSTFGDGYPKVAHIYPTPGRFNHGMGEFFNDDEDMEAVRESYIKKVDEYYLPLLKRAESAIEKGFIEWEKDAQGYRDRMQEARNNPISKYPACESVAVAFTEKPSESQIVLMKNRAREFEAKTNKFSILGFRMIQNKKVVSTITHAV
jgi:hypothetical protein